MFLTTAAGDSKGMYDKNGARVVYGTISQNDM